MIQANSSDRRSHSRRTASDIRASLRDRNDATVVDLGPKGLGVETTTWLGVGTPYRIRVEVAGRPIYLRGVVDWCSVNRTERTATGEAVPVYRAGIELTALESEQPATWHLSSLVPGDRNDAPGIELQIERRTEPRVPLYPLRGASEPN